MATATASGNPMVGETLTCSEPVVTGGISPYQRDYSWTDDSNAMIFESRYHSQTFVLTEEEVGKNMKCLVQCTDKGWSGGQSITVASNSVGPVAAIPTTIGKIGFLVDGVEAENNAVAAVSGGVITIDCTTAGGDAADMNYFWKIRSGNASFSSSTNNKTCSVSLGNDYPGMVLVQCDINSATSTNSPASDILTIVLAEAMSVSIPKAY